MKKFLPYIFILVIMVGIFVPLYNAHAQAGQPTPGTCTVTTFTDPTIPPLIERFPGLTYDQCQARGTGANSVTWVANGGSGTSVIQSVTEPAAGSEFSIFGWVKDGLGSLVTIATAPILSIVSWVTWLSGQILDYTLAYTIIDLKANLQDLSGINVAWKVIRDLMNITFIFILVFEGIMLIIGQGDTGRIKKFIVGLILSSILINFSLFFTKVLIDASNIVTLGFYKAILGPRADTLDFTIPGTGVSFNYGLSSPIVQQLGIQSVYDLNASNIFVSGGGISGPIIRVLGSAIILLLTAFIFFAVAIMFIVRYVTLIILLALSPVAYMGFLPFMQTYSKQWWNAFKSQLLFAPLYMIFTWVVLILMDSMNLNINAASFGAIFDNGAQPTFSSMGLLLNFAIVIGLLIFSFIIAKSVSTQGSQYISKMTGKFSSFAGGTILGASSRIGRNTIGRAGNAVANNEYLKDTQANGNIFTRNLASLAVNRGNRAANATFDARNASSYKALESATGVKLGKGADVKKENYRAIREAQLKDAAKETEKYKPSDAAVENAKEKLNKETVAGRQFFVEEEARKRAHETYITSSAYTNSTEFKANEVKKEENRRDTIKSKDTTIDFKNAEQRLANLRRDLQNSTGTPAEKEQITQRIRILESETTQKQKIVQDLEAAIKKRAGEIDEYENGIKNYISDEKRRLIALSGGIKEEKKKGQAPTYKDAAGNLYDSNVKIASAYEQRAEAVADRIANAGPLFRYSANTLGMVTNTAGLNAPPMTKAERQELARKIRKAPKGKSAKDKLAEAAKEMTKEDEDTEEKTTETPATPETPPATETGGESGEKGGSTST